MMSMKKYTQKLKKQARTNPGHKTKYVPLPRGRACAHKMKTDYNRRNRKQEAKNAIAYWNSYKED